MKVLKKEHFKVILSRKWVVLFVAFFFFFFVETSFSVSIKIFLEKRNQDAFFGFILFTNQVSLILMPLIVSRLANKFGNIRIVKYFLLILSVLFFITFFINNFIYVLFIVLPFFVRIFNTSLNPYMGKESNEKQGAFVFAVRDIFLYLGAASGLLLGNIISEIDFEILNFTRIFTFIFLITAILLFFHPDANYKSSSKFDNPRLKFSFKHIQHRKRLIIFILISIGSNWIFFSIEFYVIFLSEIGVQASEIFFFFSLSYFIVPIFALISSMASVKKGKKNWFLFDIAFDIVSLILILLSGSFYSLILITLTVINLRDFVYPISISYFFDCFKKSEMNDVWAIYGTASSLFSLPLTFVASILFGVNPISIFLVSFFVVPVQFTFAYFFLPKQDTFKKTLDD